MYSRSHEFLQAAYIPHHNVLKNAAGEVTWGPRNPDSEFAAAISAGLLITGSIVTGGLTRTTVAPDEEFTTAATHVVNPSKTMIHKHDAVGNAADIEANQTP